MTEESYPISGQNYPQTFQEFDKWFETENKCIEFIKKLRWPHGFQCPYCDLHDEPWITARDNLRCRGCRNEISITAGTIFEGTRKPLRDWFFAMWFVTSQKYGANALGLQRVLGLGSYQTAWTWLHKMRRAMVIPGRNQLTGTVEIDETFVGASEENVYGRGTEKKTIVVVAAEVRGKATGRIRLQKIEEASAGNLIPFIKASICEGALVVTDGWQGYTGLQKNGYKHEIKNIKQSGKKAHELLPHVHRVDSLLKRWLDGMLQGGVQQRHLDYYLDEFTFRFNRRTSRSRGLLFYRLMQQAVMTCSTPYRGLIGGKDAPLN